MTNTFFLQPGSSFPVAFKYLKRIALAVAAIGISAFSMVAQADGLDLPSELQAEAHGKYMLVEFYAPYCGTCQMMKPHVEALKNKIDDKVVVRPVDASQPPNVKYVRAYGIKGTPTYILFNPSGKMVYRMDDRISPVILEKQVMKQIGQGDRVSNSQ